MKGPSARNSDSEKPVEEGHSNDPRSQAWLMPRSLGKPVQRSQFVQAQPWLYNELATSTSTSQASHRGLTNSDIQFFPSVMPNLEQACLEPPKTRLLQLVPSVGPAELALRWQVRCSGTSLQGSCMQSRRKSSASLVSGLGFRAWVSGCGLKPIRFSSRKQSCRPGR